MGKRHKLVSLTLGVSLTFTLTGVHSVFAETAHPSVHKQHLEDKQSKLHSVQNKKSQAQEKAEKLEDEIAKKQKKVNQTQKNRKETQSDINSLKKQIMKTQDDIGEGKKDLKKRVSSMYKNGGSVAYLDVVLGSENFSNFLDRIMALKLITSQDKKTIDDLNDNKDKLDESKKLIVKKLDKLQAQMDSLNDVSADLKDQKKKQEKLADELGDKGDQIKKDIASVQQAIETAQANESQQHEQAATNKSSQNKQSDKHESSQTKPTNTAKKKNHSTVKTTAKNNGSKKKGKTGGNQRHQNMTTKTSNLSGSFSGMIQKGKQYIGNSTYKMGRGRTQADVQNGVFDCSAFVHWAFNQIGQNVGFTTDSLASAGTKVSRNSLKPGDMVFYNTYKTNGHVGIYIGSNQFIGAQTSGGVGIVNMNNSYWKPKFNHAQRIMN